MVLVPYVVEIFKNVKGSSTNKLIPELDSFCFSVGNNVYRIGSIEAYIKVKDLSTLEFAYLKNISNEDLEPVREALINNDFTLEKKLGA